MLKKYQLDQLKAIFAQNYDVDPKGWSKEEIKNLLCDSLDAEEFEDRGYQFGTPQESWDAINRMCDAIEIGEPVPPDVGLWFLNAVNQMRNEDPRELLRQLGLIVHGRSRVVNKFDICERMVELVDKEGQKKSDAARSCAAEFGCSTSTALHWYYKRNEIYDN